jgi:hypothetical protein
MIISKRSGAANKHVLDFGVSVYTSNAVFFYTDQYVNKGLTNLPLPPAALTDQMIRTWLASHSLFTYAI